MQKRAIGGKTLNSGIRGGLWEKKHYDKMRDAVWLFGWLVHRQTTQRNGTGLVLRGKPLTYADISADTDFTESALRRWMVRLKRAGYIEVKYSLYSRMVVRILNAKKFNPRQLDFPPAFTETSRAELDEMDPSSRAGLSEISRADLSEMMCKGERLKEGIEFEQKHLGSRGAGAPAASPPTDPRHSEVFRFCYEAFRGKYGQPPTWGAKEGKKLSGFLKEHRGLAAEEIFRRYRNLLDSTAHFHAEKHGSLFHLLNNFDEFLDGPLYDRRPEGRSRAQATLGDRLETTLASHVRAEQRFTN
jgi:DNA-binding transcriptional ArsR family regulator